MERWFGIRCLDGLLLRQRLQRLLLLLILDLVRHGRSARPGQGFDVQLGLIHHPGEDILNLLTRDVTDEGDLPAEVATARVEFGQWRQILRQRPHVQCAKLGQLAQDRQRVAAMAGKIQPRTEEDAPARAMGGMIVVAVGMQCIPCRKGLLLHDGLACDRLPIFLGGARFFTRRHGFAFKLLRLMGGLHVIRLLHSRIRRLTLMHGGCARFMLRGQAGGFDGLPGL